MVAVPYSFGNGFCYRMSTSERIQLRNPTNIRHFQFRFHDPNIPKCSPRLLDLIKYV